MIRKTVLLSSIALLTLNSCAAHSDDSAKVKQLLKQSRDNMVLIKGGSFMMGPGPKNKIYQGATNQPSHKVVLSSFYMSKYNTSYGDFDIYSKATGKPLVQPGVIHAFFRDANHPANFLTWYQANDYCTWLAKETGLPYSLPTEAQWEYAARDRGKDWAYATNNGKAEPGVNLPDLKDFQNQKGNTALGLNTPLPIGSMPPNPLGLYGMVHEVNMWVKDWFSPDYYSHSPVSNPQGPKMGTLKVQRSGASDGGYQFGNNFLRAAVNPNMQNGGFRCVINSSLLPSQLGVYAKGYPKKQS